MTYIIVIAVILAVIALYKHLTLVQIQADVAKAHAGLSALMAKGVSATKADVNAAIADLKKWV